MPEQRLDTALESWREWSVPVDYKPTIVKHLTGGQTNQTFLIQTTSATKIFQAVLRLNSPYSQQLGIDRKREKVILRQVADASFAPATYYNNLDILVSEFLPGKTLTPRKLNSTQLDSYHQLMRGIHKLPLSLSPFSYKNHAEHYWQLLIENKVTMPLDLKTSRNQLLKIIEHYEASYGERVLCHHDAGLHNLIETDGKMQLIDWEYAAPGIKDFDLAATDIIQPNNPNSSTISDYINRLWQLVNNHFTKTNYPLIINSKPTKTSK